MSLGSSSSHTTACLKLQWLLQACVVKPVGHFQIVTVSRTMAASTTHKFPKFLVASNATTASSLLTASNTIHASSRLIASTPVTASRLLVAASNSLVPVVTSPVNYPLNFNGRKARISVLWPHHQSIQEHAVMSSENLATETHMYNITNGGPQVQRSNKQGI
jgi:hypothetical protein